MEAVKGKVDYEKVLAASLRDARTLSDANTVDLGELILVLARENRKFRDDLLRTKEELNSCKKRLQRLEIAKKQGKASVKPPNGRGRSPSASSLRKSGRSVGRSRKDSKSNARSVRFDSEESKRSVSNSVNSKKNKPNNGSTTRIKLWKLLLPEKRKELRKEEDLAYKKVPLDKWNKMSNIERTVASKDRKILIQRFQERLTTIAKGMAEKKAKDKANREAEKMVEDKSEGLLADQAQRSKPSQPKYTAHPGGEGGTKGQSPAKKF